MRRNRWQGMQYLNILKQLKTRVMLCHKPKEL